MAAEICCFVLKLGPLNAPRLLWTFVLSSFINTVFDPVILVGLALIVGSTDGKALKEQQNIFNCLDYFCPIIYLYVSNNDQVEYKESYNKIEEMDVELKGRAVSAYTLYNQDNFEGCSVKVDSSNSITLEE